MCAPPKDKSAQIARQQAEENQRRIAEGRGYVDQAFGGFDDSFFERQRQTAANFLLPQVNDQFERSRETAIKRLASTGGLQSSAGARIMGDLQAEFKRQQAAQANRAFDIAQQRRSQVESSRQDILSQLEAGLSPADAAARASTEAERFSGDADISPLGDIFANTLNQFGQAAILQQRGFRGTGIEGLNPGRRGSSVKVIE